MLRRLNRAKLEKSLSAPIKELRRTGDDPLAARAALKEVLDRAERALPKAGHTFIGQNDAPLHDASSRYLLCLYKVRKDLYQNDWVNACGDLLSVLHCFHIEDGRVLNEIVHLLEAFL